MGHWALKHWLLAYNATGDSESIHYQICTAFQTTIRALGLSGVSSDSIVVKKLPLKVVKDFDALSYPVIILSPVRPRSIPEQGAGVADDTIYGVNIAIYDDDDQERTLSANMDTRMLWVENIRKALHNKRIDSVSTVYRCVVQYKDVMVPRAWTHNLYASGLHVDVYSREHRT